MEIAQARERIRELEDLNAFISLTEERGEGEVVGVKDLIDVAGAVTTGGGAILPKRAATDDAPVVALLRQHGCVMVGKTNLHEWAFGTTSINPHYGAVHNPRDTARMAGGSSGGSAVAVATGMCDWAIGSDTGGSIRIPASLCGVVGFKPTYGRISTERVIPLSASLDTLGPLANDLETAARAAEMMIGGGVDLRSAKLEREPRLAVPEGWVTGLDAPTTAAWARFGSGATPIPFPSRRALARSGDTILRFEAANYHRDWMRRFPERYGRDVLRRLRTSAQTTERAYRVAVEARARLREEAASAMGGWDALLLPATAQVAPLLTARWRRDLTKFTRAFNTTGQPVITLPLPVDGLPVGLQVVGHHNREAELVAVARWLEKKWGGREAPSAPKWVES